MRSLLHFPKKQKYTRLTRVLTRMLCFPRSLMCVARWEILRFDDSKARSKGVAQSTIKNIRGVATRAREAVSEYRKTRQFKTTIGQLKPIRNNQV